MPAGGAALIADAPFAALPGFPTAERTAAYPKLEGEPPLLPRTVQRAVVIDYRKHADEDASFHHRLTQGLALRAAEYWSAYPMNHPELPLAAVLRPAIAPPIEEDKRVAIDRLL